MPVMNKEMIVMNKEDIIYPHWEICNETKQEMLDILGDDDREQMEM